MAILYMNGKRMRQMFDASTKWLLANEEVLNEMNVFPVPDGDTGTNMGGTLRSLLQAINEPSLSNELSELAKSAADAALMGARGNSGVILSQMIQGFVEGFKGNQRLNSMDIAIALKQSYQKAYDCVSSPQEGTILTVLRDGVFAAYEEAKTEVDIIKVVDVLLRESKKSLANTPNLLPALKEAGVVDAGAFGFVLIIEGIHKMMNQIPLPELGDMKGSEIKKMAMETNLIKENYGYCTEFMVSYKLNDLGKLKEELLEMGDSLVFVPTNDKIKVHIHTKHPGSVMEKCLEYGVLMNIKIENMDSQHFAKEKLKDNKKVEFVAVALGEGVEKIFKSLGCGAVIKGGQTMNPSVRDISEVVSNLNADNIIILPNNGNVVFAVEQVKALHPELNIYTVASKTVPEGFAAMLAWDQGSDIQENLKNMNLALGRVKTAEITYAIKDVVIGETQIKEGDLIAIYNERVLSIYDSVLSALLDLLDNMKEEESSIVTLLFSERVDSKTMELIRRNIEEKHQDLDLEIHHGGQPYFSIIVSVE